MPARTPSRGSLPPLGPQRADLLPAGDGHRDRHGLSALLDGALSLKTNAQIFTYPPRLVEFPLLWQHYVDIWTDPRMDIRLQAWNTFVYATARTFLQLLFSSMAAYVLARYRFPYRNTIFYLILATVMIPHEVMLVPLYIMVKSVPFAGGNDWLGAGGTGWLDTKAGLILPGHHLGLLDLLPAPVLHDAAEGARGGRAHRRLLGVRHLVAGGAADVDPGVDHARRSSRSSTRGRTTLGRSSSRRARNCARCSSASPIFSSHDGTDWAMLMTGAVISTLPLIALFLLLQRFIVTGISFGVGK